MINLEKIVRVVLATEVAICGFLLVSQADDTPPKRIIVNEEITLTNPYQKYEDFFREAERVKKERELQEQLEREAQLKAEQERLRAEEEERQRLASLVPHFNPYNINELSNLTKEQMYTMLDGTALVTLVDAFYWYEQQYQVNAIFMMSLTAEESGWGRSSLAISNNNLSGHKSSTGEWAYYSDWGECLEESFRLISEEYTDPNGLFYTGSSIYDINLVYCPDPIAPNSWANNINAIAQNLLGKLGK